jgi:hypothetical protein
MTLRYIAYGLRIASQRPLPELVEAEWDSDAGADVQAPDVEIVWEEVPSLEEGSWFKAHGEGEEAVAQLCFRNVCDFLVQGGRRITVSPAPDASPETVRLPLLGAAMALVLHQRALFALHGSAISIGGRAAIFIGRKGQGKSTLASALYGSGHDLLADDIAVITPSGTSSGTPIESSSSPLMVRPGFPQLKLVPDSLKAALGMEEHELPHVASAIVDKRAHRIRERFAESDVPLARVYILDDGEWDFSAPPSQVSLANVLTHSYSARFGTRLLHGAAAGRHLAMCSRLISGGFVRLLRRPRDFDLLSETVRRVEEDVAGADTSVP